jgi:hypothetical protein
MIGGIRSQRNRETAKAQQAGGLISSRQQAVQQPTVPCSSHHCMEQHTADWQRHQTYSSRNPTLLNKIEWKEEKQQAIKTFSHDPRISHISHHLLRLISVHKH